MNIKCYTSFIRALFFTVVLTLAGFPELKAQEIDILLKGGHVINPKNNINGIMDVGVTAGKVFKVAANITANMAGRTVDVSGLYVTRTRVDGTQKIQAELTMRAGRVMWDLNGIARTVYDSVSRTN